ncbi:MAG: phosphoserine phosphatase SerB [Pseudomonadota bacterium]
MPLVATLITDPSNPLLSQALAADASGDMASGRPDWLATGIACDVPLKEGVAGDDARAAMADALGGQPVDIVVQEAVGRAKDLLIADMDSTMIDQECVDELAAQAGVYEKVAGITKRAMNGEIEFEAAMRERVALLAGLELATIGNVIENRITLAAGGRTTVATMKASGAYTALVSGGFTAFTDPISEMLGFDENRANVLGKRDGKLDGTVAEPVLGQQAKVNALNELCASRGISVNEAIAVGDGANDLGMLELAGSGVAMHAKPVVSARARMRIDHGDLTALLYIQGYRRDQFRSVPEQ